MALTKEQHDELAVSYASLILFDGEAEITSDAITTVLQASGNTEVEPYWPTLFAGLLSKDGKIMELITAGGPSAGAAAAAGGAAAEEEAAPAEEEKKEEEEEADLAGGMDMFGDDEDY